MIYRVISYIKSNNFNLHLLGEIAGGCSELNEQKYNYSEEIDLNSI